MIGWLVWESCGERGGVWRGVLEESGVEKKERKTLFFFFFLFSGCLDRANLLRPSRSYVLRSRRMENLISDYLCCTNMYLNPGPKPASSMVLSYVSIVHCSKDLKRPMIGKK